MPSDSPGYLALSLTGSPEDLEATLPTLLEAGCIGTAESDCCGPQVAFFPEGSALGSCLSRLADEHPQVRVTAPRFLPDRDWLEIWRRSFTGFPIGKRFAVRPSWEPPSKTERIVLRIDPERAFGTGTHETTRLCVELLEDYARAGTRAIDAGAGTAILAMVLARLGCSRVTAIEADADAVQCARLNLERNDLQDRVEIVAALLSGVAPEPAELVVANLSASVLELEFSRLARFTLPGGVLILGGILIDQADALEQTAPSDLTLVERREDGEWVALVYGKS